MKCCLFLITLLLCLQPIQASTKKSTSTNKSNKQFKPNPKFANMESNTIIDLGPFKWERPEGEPNANAVSSYSGMVYDAVNHRILLFGGGHAATFTDAIYSFSFETLTWEALYKPTPHKFYIEENVNKSFWTKGGSGNYPRPIGRHTYDLLVISENGENFFMLRDGHQTSYAAAKGIKSHVKQAGGIYNFKTQKWTIIPAKDIKFGGWGCVSEYDPISKKIIGIDRNRIFAFDTTTRKSSNILNGFKKTFKGTNNGYSGCLVYFPPNKKMYIFTMKGKNVSELNLDRTDLKKSTVKNIEKTDGITNREVSLVYDSKNKIIGGGVDQNKFFAFDPQKKTWESKTIQGGKPQNMRAHCIAYSPVDNVYIFIGNGGKKKNAKRIWAYRWKK